MDLPRDRQPWKPDYQLAVGQATLCFAILEQNVLSCYERVDPGALRLMQRKRRPSGMIARGFAQAVRDMPSCPERTELAALASRFFRLVKLRNRIVHGRPVTSPTNETRLNDGGILEIPELQAAADSFSECSVEADRLFHGFLSSYRPVQRGRIRKEPRLDRL